ncbi:hypothetical protein VTN00DRAFT_2697 [Thermoascus crustaceus]|uniref:uncharacterized protein n=1 Tax=Thermoascus crustaceus TaxID=5088 RepID=UPI0037432CF6
MWEGRRHDRPARKETPPVACAAAQGRAGAHRRNNNIHFHRLLPRTTSVKQPRTDWLELPGHRWVAMAQNSDFSLDGVAYPTGWPNAGMISIIFFSIHGP